MMWRAPARPVGITGYRVGDSYSVPSRYRSAPLSGPSPSGQAEVSARGRAQPIDLGQGRLRHGIYRQPRVAGLGTALYV